MVRQLQEVVSNHERVLKALASLSIIIASALVIWAGSTLTTLPKDVRAASAERQAICDRVEKLEEADERSIEDRKELRKKSTEQSVMLRMLLFHQGFQKETIDEAVEVERKKEGLD